MSESIETLRTVLDRLQAINAETTARLIRTSSAGDRLATAYQALSSGASAAEGRAALREALAADGVREEAIDQIDALYLHCLVGGPAISSI